MLRVAASAVRPRRACWRWRAASSSGYAVRPVPRIAADNVGKPVSRLQEAFGEPRKIDHDVDQVGVRVVPAAEARPARRPASTAARWKSPSMRARSTCSAIRCRTSDGRTAARWSGGSAWRSASRLTGSQRRAISRYNRRLGRLRASRIRSSSPLYLISILSHRRSGRLDRARDQDRPKHAVDLGHRAAAAGRLRSPMSWWRSCRSFSAAEPRAAPRSGVQRMIDPDRDLRRASAEVEISGNVDARRRLAEELFERGQYDAGHRGLSRAA